MDSSHTLVIGGTGMLAEATRHVAARSAALTIVARRPDRLDELELEADRIDRIAFDYHRTELLLDRLEQSVARHGEFEFALTWVHSSGLPSLLRVANMLDAQNVRARLVDVQGSAASRPDGESERHRVLDELDGLDYQRVILGFVLGSEVSRWLTDDEISSGVIESIVSGAEEHVVGLVEPWERRP